jgi:hypothetical protein
MGRLPRCGLLVGVVLSAALGACGTGTEIAPIGPAGTVSVPARPIIVDPLPGAWVVNGAELETGDRLPDWMQELYLPPGSTPEAGPALAVGGFYQDDGRVACGPGRPTVIPWAGGREWPVPLHRIGNLVILATEVDTDQPGYVLGRDLTEEQVITAARAARFVAGESSEIRAEGLPEGFRRVATAPVAPGSVFGEVVRLMADDGSSLIEIGAYEGDAASELLTRFWNSAADDDLCRTEPFATATRRIDRTNVVVRGHSQALVEQVADRLRAVERTEFEAFRAKIDDQPASALAPCPNRDGNVYVEGVVENIRWVLAMPAAPGPGASSCETYVIDRRWAGGGGTGGGDGSGRLLGPGSYGVVLLGGSAEVGPDRVRSLAGGTVPATARRVVVSVESGGATEAVLVDGGRDPGRRYFGALLVFPNDGSLGWGRTTVMAYDAAGREVARANPYPLDPR